MKILGILLTGLGILSVSPARASGISCQVPGFLNFNLQDGAAGSSILSINQYSYGLNYGPATTLARSLNLIPDSGIVVDSLSINQSSGVAVFSLSNGFSKSIDLGQTQILIRDDVLRSNGSTYSAKVMTVASSEGDLIEIPAQASLCKIHTSVTAVSLFSSIPKIDLVSSQKVPCNPAPPFCGPGTYAGPCCYE